MADIKMAFGDRLETQHLLSGRVTIRGFEVDLHNPGTAPAPIFHDMVTTLPYDVGELTITNFIIAKDTGVPIVGLPIFPNVFYPLTGVVVNRKAGIASPADLSGKRIGVGTGYASNPAAWLRGILAHQFDVSAESITWVEGEADSLRGVPYPRSSRYKSERAEKLNDLLAAGEIDAYVGAGGSSEASDAVGLLVDDPFALLMAYFEETGSFPINTMIVMKESSVKAYPGLADAVAAASDEAHAIYDAEEPDSGIHQGIPIGEARKRGLFPRPHGLDTHGATVRMLVQYLYEQGLIKKLWTLDELFV
jgi:4,5-dihydroxyphthalate decarboxylase